MDSAATPTTNFIDLYRRGSFILETKQGVEKEESATPLSDEARARAAKRKKGHGVRGTDTWSRTMLKARAQAERYARLLPPAEGRPPFVLVADVGFCIEVYSEFTRTGGVYTPFPDTSQHRLRLEHLADAAVRERLRLIWTDPLSLDPARRTARVTRDIADRLARLARSLENSGHDPADVAQFLMRCLFTMFAEDVKLLPPGSFLNLLTGLRDPSRFAPMVEHLWQTMNTGGFSPILQETLLRFNGGLFENPRAIALNADQLAFLIEAARAEWSSVEPAIFGTLLERALDPVERHKLGAHYTPRAYVERLVVPTIIEPLRAEWAAVQATAIQHVTTGSHGDAATVVEEFHQRLCNLRVLDPACGTGNFLYVSLELMKRLEGEILDFLSGILQGYTQTRLQTQTVTVDPHQFLGIEINPRAAAIAELVLWIGYLQWHFRTHGEIMPPEPVIRNFHNIECRDAVLAYDRVEPLLDDEGRPVTRWDGRTMKKSPVTGEDIPDDTARVPVYTYINPRKAEWPRADFIVGNPPFVGNKRMRDALGGGYAESLRNVYVELSGSVDFVMYWWMIAAEALKLSDVRRFGLITTNSITQTFNQEVIEKSLKDGCRLSIVYAVTDHPWVDSGDGAAVRVAITVVEKGIREGLLESTRNEEDFGDPGARKANDRTVGHISSALRVGADIESAVQLLASRGIAYTGMYPLGQGFVLTRAQADSLTNRNGDAWKVIKPYATARRLTQTSGHAYIIDFHPLQLDEVRQLYPELLQWVTDRVKPGRDLNPVEERRRNWWLFTRPIPALRDALGSIDRYIAVPRTAKYFNFQFLPSSTIVDTSVVAIAISDAYALGLLSSNVHLGWAYPSGGRLGVGNDPRYQHQRTFRPFPFPDPPETLKQRIRELGEQLDAHRKSRRALHPTLTLTGLYNILEKLRAGQTLTPKERTLHEQGLVSVLKQIHDDLDDAVFRAYGWDDLAARLADIRARREKADPAADAALQELNEEILQRLVDLNHQRADEEQRGLIRWLRPEFQAPGQATVQTEMDIETPEEAPAARRKVAAPAEEKQPWPAGLLAQTQAVRALLASNRAPLSPDDLARRLHRARKERLAEILETLASLGQVQHHPDGRYTNA